MRIYFFILHIVLLAEGFSVHSKVYFSRVRQIHIRTRGDFNAELMVVTGFGTKSMLKLSRIALCFRDKKKRGIMQLLTPEYVAKYSSENWLADCNQRPIHVKILRKGDSLERKHVTDYTKSLVFVNDTYRCALRSGIVPLCGADAYRDRRDDDRTLFTLLDEFRFESPGFMHLLPAINDRDQARLWVTNFGLTIRGHVLGIDLTGQLPARKCKAPFVWPNSVEFVASGYFTGINSPGILVADGFLVPGKTNGNIWFVTDPGGDQEVAIRLVTSKSWFYHRAIPLKLGGHEGILTARAYLPMMPFSRPQGELVWIEKPNTLNPTASWNLPWREVVIAQGPDVMFEVLDLDPDDQTLEIFAAEFFGRKLTMHSIMWDDRRNSPVVVERQVIDENLGQAYSVTVADLQGEKSHLLVTTHEYEPDPTLDKTPFYWIPGTNSKWTYTSSPVPVGSRSIQNSNSTIGGSLFAYRIPKKWRQYRPSDYLTEDRLIQQLPRVFRTLEQAEAGYLELGQVEQAIRVLGIDEVNVDEGELSRMLQDVDWDGSGKLDFQQFRDVMLGMFKSSRRGAGGWAQALWRLGGAMGLSMRNIETAISALDEEGFRARLPAVFAQIDRDGSGSIDMEEMKQAMQSMGVTCSDVELAAMFMDADWDGNGQIDFAEFENLMLRMLFGTRGGGNVFASALNRLEAVLKSTVSSPEAVRWTRSTLASGFRVKRASINPGAPGFAYPFHPHVSMKAQGRPPHILLAGDCADAAYVLQPVFREGDEEPQYELMASLAFEGTVGSIAVGQVATETSVDDGWAKFFVPVYETDRIYMFKCGGPPVEGVEPSW